MKKIFKTMVTAFVVLICVMMFTNTSAHAATTGVTKIKDFQNLLKGWTYASSGTSQYYTHIKFEKTEPVGKKWAYNELQIIRYDSKGVFKDDINAFIQTLKNSGVKYTIKKNTSTVFIASNYSGADYTYHYIVKTKSGYTVNELVLQRLNENWRYGYFSHETISSATYKSIEKLAPTLMTKFLKYTYADTLKSEPVYKTFAAKKEWKLTGRSISGNAKLEFMPNGWSRTYEKTTNGTKYELNVNKTVITKTKHTQLLKKYKNISILKKSSTNVKEYRLKDIVSITDDEPSLRSGDNRIIFVQKKGATKVDYYKVYVDVISKPQINTWTIAEQAEADKAFNIVANSLIKANK